MLYPRVEYFEYEKYPPLIGLNCSTSTFTTQFKLYMENKQSLSAIMYYLEGNIQHWKNMLTQQEYPKDLSYMCMFAYLERPEEEHAELLETIRSVEDIEQDIRLIWCKLITSEWIYKIYPAKPYGICKILSRCFVTKIANYISREIYKEKQYKDNIVLYPLEYPEEQPIEKELSRDIMLDIRNDKYYNYLLTLFFLDTDREKFKELTKTETAYLMLWRYINEYSIERRINQ